MANGTHIHIPDLANWRKSKVTVSLGTIAVCALLLWGAHEYTVYHLDGVFMSAAQAESLTEKVEQALQKSTENSEQLLKFVHRIELSDAREQLDNLRGQLQETELWEAANGENEISQARKRDLRQRIDRQEDKVDCLERGEVNCD